MYTAGHHFRCYRGKATTRYILENKRGIEMIDLEGRDFVKNDWVRGICRYGIMPCNGMIYSTPTPCSCYPAALLTGFNALAADGKMKNQRHQTESLEKGPAFGETMADKPAEPSDWPRFRHNNSRSGATTTKVNTNLSENWKTKLSGKLSQPVVADGTLLVASVDEQTVYALSAETGEELWSYTVDGRVDSPPTYDQGRLFFGSRSGWVYSLRASDGMLIWRYRVAPSDDQIVSYNQLESVWPARGSALVVDGVVYAAAGRSSYLDDGIVVVGLDAATGRKLYHARLKNDPQDPAIDKGNSHVIDGFKLDVLSSDGKYIYMQAAAFDNTLESVSNEVRQTPGIYASAGFLDDHAWNRNAWRCGTSTDSLSLNKKNLAGMPRTGQILVFDENLVYGVKYFLGHSGQSAVFYPGQDGYKLFAHQVDAPAKDAAAPRPRKRKRRNAETLPGYATWSQMLPVRVRGMTKADGVLFVAGVPDIVEDQDPLAALEGRRGAILRAYSAGDGQELAEMKLAAPPVFDGLIAANGKLFMSAVDGSVTCLGE
jgi:outer membrane protein assembly factor BamB